MRNELPIFNKHGVSEMKIIDSKFGTLVETFLLEDHKNHKKKEHWKEFLLCARFTWKCRYIND